MTNEHVLSKCVDKYLYVFNVETSCNWLSFQFLFIFVTSCVRTTKYCTILCYNSLRNELWLMKEYLWSMWEHTFTNYNLPCDELWYKIVSFSVILAFSFCCTMPFNYDDKIKQNVLSKWVQSTIVDESDRCGPWNLDTEVRTDLNVPQFFTL